MLIPRFPMDGLTVGGRSVCFASGLIHVANTLVVEQSLPADVAITSEMSSVLQVRFADVNSH